MSYVRYTKTLALDNGSSRGHAVASEDVWIKPGHVPTVEELQAKIPGSRIVHGFQIIANNGRILAERKGLPSEAAARRAVRDLRRALLPGVRQDVEQLAQAWQEGYDYGVDDSRQAESVDLPEYGPNRTNPYRQELEEAGRG